MQHVADAKVMRDAAGEPARSAALVASARVCEQITRREAKNFYYGLRTTPANKREALYAIYAWMRLLDDLVDEPERFDALAAASNDESVRALGEARSIERFLEASRAALRGEVDAAEPHKFGPTIWPSFAHALATQPIEHAWIELMIEGVLADREPREFASVHELLAYCHRVGGTVGMCCTSVWGVRDARERTAALHKADRRGRAFQIINILRDVAKDGQMKPSRCYVPAALLRTHGLSAAQLAAWENPAACERVVRELATIARNELAASEGLERTLESACGAALWTMTRIYTGLLVRIEAQPKLAVATEPVRVPRGVKLSYALASAVMPSVVVKWKAWA